VRRPDIASLCSPLGSALLVAAALFCVCVLQWHAGRQAQLPLEPLSVATSLASGEGFANPFWQPSGPTAWITPAIPLIFAGTIILSKWLAIQGFYLIVGFNLFAVGATVYLILRFCIPHWSTAPRLAFCAGFLGYCLLDGNVLTYPGALTAAETALLLAGLASLWRQPGNFAALLMVFFGDALLCMTHPGLALGGVAAAGVLGLLIWRAPAGRSVGFLRSGAVAAVAAVLVGAGPWAIRNRLVFQQWIPAKSNGYFELVLAHEQTDDGVLTEASILSGNPSTNLRVFREYQRLGEKAFLEGYRHRALRIVTGDTGRYLLYSRNRLFNALAFSRSPGDTDLMLANLDQRVADRMVGRGLLLYYGIRPTTYLWPKSNAPASVEKASLVGAGVSDVDAAMADWTRAQDNIRNKEWGFVAIVVGLLWAGVPTACVLAAVFIGSPFAPRLVLAGAAIYLLALLPNVLITHDIRHQCDFDVLFALFVAAPMELLRRRRARPDVHLGAAMPELT
jgi:hypothetical protein